MKIKRLSFYERANSVASSFVTLFLRKCIDIHSYKSKIFFMKKFLVVATFFALLLLFTQCSYSNDAKACYNRGVDKFILGDYKGAIADYDEAISINPNDAMTYYNRGRAKHDLKDYKGAIADYDKSIRINPYQAAAYHLRGLAKENLNDYEGAVADWEKAIELVPSYKNAIPKWMIDNAKAKVKGE